MREYIVLDTSCNYAIHISKKAQHAVYIYTYTFSIGHLITLYNLYTTGVKYICWWSVSNIEFTELQLLFFTNITMVSLRHIKEHDSYNNVHVQY
jgi:hypothetical protein